MSNPAFIAFILLARRFITAGFVANVLVSWFFSMWRFSWKTLRVESHCFLGSFISEAFFLSMCAKTWYIIHLFLNTDPISCVWKIHKAKRIECNDTLRKELSVYFIFSEYLGGNAIFKMHAESEPSKLPGICTFTADSQMLFIKYISQNVWMHKIIFWCNRCPAALLSRET